GVILALGFLGMAALDSLWQFYVCYVVGRGVAQAVLSGVVPAAAMTAWFDRRRGRAIGLVSTFFQLSTVLLVPLAQWLVVASSWRLVYVLLAVTTAVLLAPPAALLL